MDVIKETASGKFVDPNSKEPDWCDKETFAEIKNKFNKDDSVFSQEQIGKLIEENDLMLNRIVKP